MFHAAAVALLACVLCAGAWVVWDTRRDARAQAERALQNLAGILEQDVARNAELFDLSLQDVAAGSRLPGLWDLDPELRQAALFGRMARARHVGTILLLNERGDADFEADSPVSRRANFADREFFRVHRERPDAGLHVSRPLVSRLTGQPTVVFSRRVDGPGGAFAGVAGVGIRLAYFQDLFARLELGTQGSVTLFRDDGVVLARSPHREDYIGRDLSAGDAFRHFRVAPSGTFRAVAALDGVERLFAFRRVGELPLIVNVGFGVDEVFATWRRKAVVIGALLLVLSGAAALLFALLRRELRRRERAEARLREDEAGFRLLAEHAGDVVSRVGPDGKRRYVSPAVTRVLGLAQDELLGRSMAEMVHPDDRPAAAAAAAAVLAGAVEEAAVTCRVRRGDGAVAWVEAIARAVRDPATGAPDGYVAVWRDATARRRVEREREAHAVELEAANDGLERMARHLAAARDAAEAANEAKSRFLASMSHELRTPLNGVLGHAQLLRLEGGLNVAQSERVEAMLGAGRHLLGMINRVLALSEIEAERLEVHAAEFDPDEAARACLDQVRPAAGAKGLALDLVAAPDAPGRVLADPTRLRQVLLNLLSNAVKFTARGSVRLRLLRAAGGGLRAEVADTGPGIPAGKRARLFREFERLGADAAAAEGAGLGLSISVRLVRAMGGRLGHEDNPGGGCVFWLELPEVPPIQAGPAAATGTRGSTPARPLRVLVVDDVAMNRDIARSFLRAAGHEASCAAGGAEAVEAAGAGDFDAVLMDVRMPGVDGLEATRRIRALAGARGRVPVVALTAQAFAEQVADCRAAGMDAHLAKPFTQDALLEALASTVAPRPAAPSQAPSGANRRAAASWDVAGSAQPEARGASTAGGGDAPPAAASTPLPLDAADSEAPVLDLEAFDRTAVFLPPEEVGAYLRALALRSEALLRRLRGAGAPGHGAEGLAEAAHAFAGSAGMLGFRRAADAARRFERAREDASPETPASTEALIVALEASLDVLRRRASTAEWSGAGPGASP